MGAKSLHEEEERVTAYVIRWWETRGVLKREGRVNHHVSSKMFVYEEDGHKVTVHGNDWNRNWSAALREAENRRQKKVASTERKLAKLRNMEITVEGESGW